MFLFTSKTKSVEFFWLSNTSKYCSDLRKESGNYLCSFFLTRKRGPAISQACQILTARSNSWMMQYLQTYSRESMRGSFIFSTFRLISWVFSSSLFIINYIIMQRQYLLDESQPRNKKKKLRNCLLIALSLMIFICLVCIVMNFILFKKEEPNKK